jgi:hypothetical protein
MNGPMSESKHFFRAKPQFFSKSKFFFEIVFRDFKTRIRFENEQIDSFAFHFVRRKKGNRSLPKFISFFADPSCSTTLSSFFIFSALLFSNALPRSPPVSSALLSEREIYICSNQKRFGQMAVMLFNFYSRYPFVAEILALDAGGRKKN